MATTYLGSGADQRRQPRLQRLSAAAVDPTAAAWRRGRRAAGRRLLPSVMLVTACGVLSPEEQLLTRFFEASRLHDTTAVAAVSAVPFNPRTDGVVRDFTVEDVQDDAAARRVVVRAAVRRLEGGTTQQRLVFTLVQRDGRWFISEIRRPAPG